MSIPYRMTGTAITMVLDGETHVLSEGSHPSYALIREAIKVKDFDRVRELIRVKDAILEFGEGHVKIEGDRILVDDYEINGTIKTRMLQQMAEGFDINPMAMYLKNVIENPSKRAVDELFDWTEACDLPFTDDGHILAYKRIRGDWTDIYTGKISNTVGTVVKMKRNMVDEDKGRTCSQGLHFCSQSYLPNYSSRDPATDRIVVVKINPRDVVAIPSDYQNAKGRCCEYLVVSEVDRSNLKFYENSIHPMNLFEGFGDDAEEGEYEDEYDNFGDDEDLDSLDDTQTYDIFEVLTDGSLGRELANCDSLEEARREAKTLMDEDETMYGVRILDENGDQAAFYENDLYLDNKPFNLLTQFTGGERVLRAFSNLNEAMLFWQDAQDDDSCEHAVLSKVGQGVLYEYECQPEPQADPEPETEALNPQEAWPFPVAQAQDPEPEPEVVSDETGAYSTVVSFKSENSEHRDFDVLSEAVDHVKMFARDSGFDNATINLNGGWGQTVYTLDSQGVEFKDEQFFPVPVPTPTSQGLVVSRSQACGILGVREAQLDELLQEGVHTTFVDPILGSMVLLKFRT